MKKIANAPTMAHTYKSINYVGINYLILLSKIESGEIVVIGSKISFYRMQRSMRLYYFRFLRVFVLYFSVILRMELKIFEY